MVPRYLQVPLMSQAISIYLHGMVTKYSKFARYFFHTNLS